MYLNPKLNVNNIKTVSKTLSTYFESFGMNFFMTMQSVIIVERTKEVTQSYIVFITNKMKVVFVG